MKQHPKETATATKRPSGLSPATIASLDRMADWWAKFHRWPKAKRIAYLVKLGALTPDGKVTRYPMDHVPLGPKE